MGPIVALATALGRVNASLLAAGRGIGILCVAIMVSITLVQVFCRYVLGSALAWPDEAARFMMLWMTGLMAPTAFRRGGFVSIDMVVSFLPRAVASIIVLVMLCLSLVVLAVGVRIGWAEVTGLGGRFDTSSLNVPISLDFSQWMKVPRAWTMASLAVGVTLLLSVNVEMILRTVAGLFGAGARLPAIADASNLGTE